MMENRDLLLSNTRGFVNIDGLSEDDIVERFRAAVAAANEARLGESRPPPSLNDMARSCHASKPGQVKQNR
jgi:hypothetical protein